MKNVNWKLKSRLIEHFGSQVEAARQLRISESRLSYIVNRHVAPSDRERQALELVFGKALTTRLLR